MYLVSVTVRQLKYLRDAPQVFDAPDTPTLNLVSPKVNKEITGYHAVHDILM